MGSAKQWRDLHKYLAGTVEKDKQEAKIMENIKEFENELDKTKEVDSHFIKPLKEVLLKLTLVSKDNERKNMPVPYVKAEIIIPPIVGKSVAEVLISEWTLTLMGLKFKKEKKGK